MGKVVLARSQIPAIPYSCRFHTWIGRHAPLKVICERALNQAGQGSVLWCEIPPDSGSANDRPRWWKDRLLSSTYWPGMFNVALAKEVLVELSKTARFWTSRAGASRTMAKVSTI